MFRKFILTSLSVLLIAFNVNAASDGELVIKKNHPADVPADVKDCFEPINRATFAFNQGLDKIIFKPVSRAYRVLPSPIRTGTGNVLNNLSSLVTIPNNILQGDLNKAGINTARFFINTTFGIVGIFDVAEIMGFQEYEKEDYGQTLGTLGIGPGCYLVLPVIGPSTVRDTVGSLANIVGGDPWYNITVVNNTEHFSEFDYWSTRATTGIDFRAKNLDSFENLEKNSLDFYASVRSLYLQDRQMKISNSNTITETMDDSDWEEIETK